MVGSIVLKVQEIMNKFLRTFLLFFVVGLAFGPVMAMEDDKQFAEQEKVAGSVVEQAEQYGQQAVFKKKKKKKKKKKHTVVQEEVSFVDPNETDIESLLTSEQANETDCKFLKNLAGFLFFHAQAIKGLQKIALIAPLMRDLEKYRFIGQDKNQGKVFGFGTYFSASQQERDSESLLYKKHPTHGVLLSLITPEGMAAGLQVGQFVLGDGDFESRCAILDRLLQSENEEVKNVAGYVKHFLYNQVLRSFCGRDLILAGACSKSALSEGTNIIDASFQENFSSKVCDVLKSIPYYAQTCELALKIHTLVNELGQGSKKVYGDDDWFVLITDELDLLIDKSTQLCEKVNQNASAYENLYKRVKAKLNETISVLMRKYLREKKPISELKTLGDLVFQEDNDAIILEKIKSKLQRAQIEYLDKSLNDIVALLNNRFSALEARVRNTQWQKQDTEERRTIQGILGAILQEDELLRKRLPQMISYKIDTEHVDSKEGDTNIGSFRKSKQKNKKNFGKKRVKTKKNNTKKKKAIVQSKEEVEEEQNNSYPVAGKDRLLKFPEQYDQRIHNWFNNDHTKNRGYDSVLYHSFSPVADNYIFSLGIQTKRPNKTHQGQIDTNYSLGGEIQYEDGHKDSVVFTCCQDPQGICYHRGFTEKKDNNLFKEYFANNYWEVIFRDEDPEQDAHLFKPLQQSDAIIEQDDELCVKIYDNRLGVRLVLYKPYKEIH